MSTGARGPVEGEPAPLFALPAVQGGSVALESYRDQKNVIVWFSRGFTCPYCLDAMGGIGQGYDELVAADTEVIQVAPNLLASAQSFFPRFPWLYPFVCDPDKRLYAVYGLGDRGALEATRTAVVSFSYAVASGNGGTWIRGARIDVVNRNFLRRLHHHAMTALEQGLFFIDKGGIVRHRIVVGPIDAIPPSVELVALVREHCATASGGRRVP
jgi:putative peptide zinc metalloprotease protein